MHRTLQKVCGGVGGVGWVCKPILVLSFGQDLSWAGKLGQAEQFSSRVKSALQKQSTYQKTAQLFKFETNMSLDKGIIQATYLYKHID